MGKKLEEIELNENEFCIDFKEEGLEESDEENNDLDGQFLEDKLSSKEVCLPMSDFDSQEPQLSESPKDNCDVSAPLKKAGNRVS